MTRQADDADHHHSIDSVMSLMHSPMESNRIESILPPARSHPQCQLAAALHQISETKLNICTYIMHTKLHYSAAQPKTAGG